MATGLGLTIGSAQSTAALDADDAALGKAEIVTVPTALALDGATVSLVADGATPPMVIAGYAGRVGDPVALIADDGSTHSGEDLVAATARCLADSVPQADAVALAHPAVWTGYQVDVLAAALDLAGLPDVAFVTEPQAAVRWMQRTRSHADDAPVVVYDLGAGSLDVTVVRPQEDPEILGAPLRSEEYSGSAFDHMTLQHVLGALPDGVNGIDPFEPRAAAALTQLRMQCRAAKEALSSDTATVLTVDLPGVRCDVRLVREELEDLLREPLADSVNLVHEAVRGAGLDMSDIGSILLVGGSSSIPLVAELLSSTLRVPVVADADPAATAASGAALLAAESAAPLPATPAETDTAAFAALGAALGAAAPAAPEVTSTFAPTAHRGGGLTTPRKAALVSAAAAAIVLLAAGGLSLGTGVFDPSSGSKSDAATTTSETTTGSTAQVAVATSPSGGPPATTDAASAGRATGATGATGSSRAVSPTDAARAATVAATTGARPPSPPAVVPEANPPQAPAAAPPPAPAYTPPAPAPSGGGTGVGQAVGDAAAGAGQGLGNVVDGAGGLVGGVLGGTGQLVGGVVGGVTDGLLGQ
ncbi:Hsp70 family protein [Rhodococcus sp. Q]|uniref:Hsp70 family protein n=1 Tax=Rhodococcus sp. Q TaxID=2502252 RepID=UPI0020165A81|nr:Hsp70 family protein [Rhodococcus sp. Q]